jgi:hypothetical protein
MRRAARQLRASDTRDGADSSGLERNLFGFVVRKRLNHAVPPALCKLEVAGSIPARSTLKGPETGPFVCSNGLRVEGLE